MEPDQQTPTPPPGDEIRQRAESRVKQRVALISHIGSYIIVNAFLVLIWLITGRGYPWFVWVMVGWGIGVAFHIFGYITGSRGGAALERMVQREMKKIEKEQDQ